MARYVIGIDGGTESIRCAIYDLSGKAVASAAAPYKTQFPHPAWAEQNPQDWWSSLCEAVRAALRKADVPAGDILALAVDTTCCTVVFLDAGGKPLRPALLWMDVRAAAEAADTLATRDPALIVNANGAGPISAEWMIPKSLWVARHEPEIFHQAKTVCEYQDYINFRLTGRIVASINNATARWHYRTHSGGFARDLVAKAGMPELADKWPKDVIRLGEVIGGLTGEASEALSLPVGLPVAQGGADAFIALLGMGVVRPGTIGFITGSSHLHLALTDREMHGSGIWGTYDDCVIPGLGVLEGGQTSTGSIVNWLRNIVGGEWNYDTLNAEAAEIAPGADGVLVQDHFQGNRTPHTDPHSRGALLGLSLNHTRAHVYRAMMEGVAFGTELIFETMRANGFEQGDIVICGGATRSDLWMQIHADVSGVPLILTEVPDAATLGSAILAAVGGGAFAGIPAAADAMVHRLRVVEPDMERHALYRPIYERYKRAYGAIKSIG
ncbi:FGGY-family carbohydrate kinase [soil metagenome]